MDKLIINCSRDVDTTSIVILMTNFSIKYVKCLKSLVARCNNAGCFANSLVLRLAWWTGAERVRRIVIHLSRQKPLHCVVHYTYHKDTFYIILTYIHIHIIFFSMVQYIKKFNNFRFSI